jgi:hypothetical protein
LQDEGETVGAMAESAFAGQLKLEGGFKTGCHRLLFAQPNGA